jgi:hypothetical protein
VELEPSCTVAVTAAAAIVVACVVAAAGEYSLTVLPLGSILLCAAHFLDCGCHCYMVQDVPEQPALSFEPEHPAEANTARKQCSWGLTCGGRSAQPVMCCTLCCGVLSPG